MNTSVLCTPVPVRTPEIFCFIFVLFYLTWDPGHHLLPLCVSLLQPLHAAAQRKVVTASAEGSAWGLNVAIQSNIQAGFFLQSCECYSETGREGLRDRLDLQMIRSSPDLEIDLLLQGVM